MNQTQKIIFKKLDLIIFLLKTLLRKEHVMSQELEALQAQVQENTDLEASAITLIQGIAAQLEAAKEDPAKVQALAESLKASAANLSAAIVANTPAA
jgi:cell division septum initiation protein DivIVA